MLSLITPNLNNAKYLEGNILAIKDLKIPFEHIVVDGGSTDGSLEILKKYPHVVVINQVDKTGMYGAIHQGFLASSGEMLTYINADDRVIPEGIEAIYKKIINKSCDVVYGGGYFDFVERGGREYWRARNFAKFFLRHGCIPTMQPSFIYSKKIYFEVGGLRFNLFKMCGDLDLFVRMAKLSASRFARVDVPVSIFMRRSDSFGEINGIAGREEIIANSLPTPNLLIRVLFYLSQFV